MLRAHAGSLFRNAVAHICDLGSSGDRAPVRQQPWFLRSKWEKQVAENAETNHSAYPSFHNCAIKV